MDKVRVSDLDFVFISYAEPNKEENWADLKNKVPWAKRVDGVKGFDSAHKVAAEKAETDFFISVDGDNILDESFLLQTLDWTKTNRQAVHRWRAKNNVNGLLYGNGGIVGWPKKTCLNMKTHENAVDKKAEIDFCWSVAHENLHNCYSTTNINSSPCQAWIAGYREGVKMSLEQGTHIQPSEFRSKIWPRNLRVLTTWMTVGADVEYGKYAILGARMGCYSTTIDSGNWKQISDMDTMIDFYDNSVVDAMVDDDIMLYGESIRKQLDIPVANLDEHQSKFFKFIMPQISNKGVQDREYK